MRVRAKAIALSTASNWLFNFALAWAVPPALSTIAYRTYFIFGTFNLFAFVHIFFMFPETAGRTLEEVEEIFAQGYTFTAWRVDRNVGRKTLKQVMELKDYFVRGTSCTRPSECNFFLLVAQPAKGMRIVQEVHYWQSDSRGAGSIISRDLKTTRSFDMPSKRGGLKK
jgi:hypothetical protein